MAVAIEILMMAPVRMSNLTTLDIEQNLVRPGQGKALSSTWTRDAVCIIFLDVNLPLADPVLHQYIDLFQLDALAHYAASNSPQMEIVITAQVIYKVSSAFYLMTYSITYQINCTNSFR